MRGLLAKSLRLLVCETNIYVGMEIDSEIKL